MLVTVVVHWHHSLAGLLMALFLWHLPPQPQRASVSQPAARIACPLHLFLSTACFFFFLTKCNMKAVKWKAKMETCLGLWAVYPFLRFLNFLTKFITHFLKPRACLPNSVQEPGKLPCIQSPSKHLHVICLSLGSDYSQI